MYGQSLKRSLTLIELLVAVALMGLLVTGIGSLHTFARFHLITSHRRAQIQNELCFVLEDMSKEIVRATGDNTNPTATHAIQSISNGFRVNIDGTTIDYTLTAGEYKIKKTEDGVSTYLNKRDVILSDAELGFVCGVLLDNAVGIEIALKGRHQPQPSQPASRSNPEIGVKTRVYSRSASRN